MRSYVAPAFLVAAFVLTPVVAGDGPALSKSPFTITNDPFPVETTVVNTMREKTCTGTVSQAWGGPEGGYFAVKAVWYRRPDGTAWMKFYWAGTGPLEIPVTELGVSAQWNTPTVCRKICWSTHYEVWPEGNNRLNGKTVDPEGKFTLTCD